MKMENEKMFELLEKFYGEFSQFKKETETRFDKLHGKIDKIDNIVIHIENDHGDKLKALFDGYVQNSEKLDRIEKEVSRQEEVILRKVK